MYYNRQDTVRSESSAESPPSEQPLFSSPKVGSRVFFYDHITLTLYPDPKITVAVSITWKLVVL